MTSIDDMDLPGRPCTAYSQYSNKTLGWKIVGFPCGKLLSMFNDQWSMINGVMSPCGEYSVAGLVSKKELHPIIISIGGCLF